jgi:hypothetical protein
MHGDDDDLVLVEDDHRDLDIVETPGDQVGEIAGPLALGEVEVGPDGLSGIVDGEGILGRGLAFRVIPDVMRRSCRLGQRSVCPAMIGPCSWRAH